MTAKTEAERLAGAQTVLAVLARGGASAGAKRGPKVRYDATWAYAQLLDLAITDPDGLPERQGAMAERLLARFVASDREQPSASWAKKLVASFYAKTAIRDQESREKFRSDPALREAFETENEFVGFCRMRDRIDEKWRKDSGLRDRFATPADYFITLMQDRASSAKA